MPGIYIYIYIIYIYIYIYPSWASSTDSALTRMESKLKTDIVLNDETSEIELDLCAFSPIGECPSSCLIAGALLY